VRKIELLQIERIGDDLCLVFKTSDSRFKGILGALDEKLLEELALNIGAAAKTKHQPGDPLTVYDTEFVSPGRNAKVPAE
jgi:hypothetical protein